MPLNRETSCFEQSDRMDCPISSKQFSTEDPIVPSHRVEVFLPDPCVGFLGMSPLGPLPQHREDGVVHFAEGGFAHNMSVIVGPSSNFRVELCYQMSGVCLLVILHDFSDLLQERFDVLVRGFDEEFPLVLAYILSEKIEAVLNVGDEGFVL